MKYAAVGLLTLISALLALVLWSSGRIPQKLPSKPKKPTTRTKVVLRIRKICSAARLVTATVDEELEITKHSESWRGDARIVVRCPVRISYSVDLKSISEHEVAYNAKRRLLTVLIPDIKIEAVDYDLKKATVCMDLGWARTKARAGQFFQNEAQKMIHSSATELARNKRVMAKARLLTLPAVREQLQKVIRAVVPDVVVDVRFKPSSKIP